MIDDPMTTMVLASARDREDHRQTLLTLRALADAVRSCWHRDLLEKAPALVRAWDDADETLLEKLDCELHPIGKPSGKPPAQEYRCESHRVEWRRPVSATEDTCPAKT